MSYRVSGTPAGFARRPGPPCSSASSASSPDRSRQLATAAGGLSVTTPFPAVVAEPGSTALVQPHASTSTSAERVDLKTDGVPDGWTARFRGGGLTIDGAFVEPEAPADDHPRRRDPRRHRRRGNTITGRRDGRRRRPTPAALDPGR